MSLAGSRFSSDSAPGPSIMGFEDEVEQSFGRPCQTNGRFKRTYELTSSIVPRGTLFHHAVELEYSPVRLDTVQLCHAATASRVQRNSVPSTQMRCMITASRRARATIAFFSNRPIWVKHFRLSTVAVSMSLAGSRFSSDSAPGPSIMGFEDEVEQSFGRPCQTNGRFKRTYELTSSIVPRGTLFHHAVELECSPVRLDNCAVVSCGYGLPGPAKLSAINPDAVHDHGQPACQGNDSLLHAAVPGDLHRPGPEPGPSCRTEQHALGRFVKHCPHQLVSAPRYCSATVNLARLVLGGCQSKHRPD